MIYIDPPYNTGNEFIYPDNFREGIDDYLRYSGQVSGNGIKLSTNTETSGRYHSKWLNMMYSRLFLARNLLREDGVIFVSIDDHEVHNLRMLMNEIFGEENFIANVVWEKKYTRANDAKWFSDNHDHILVAARNKETFAFNLLPRSEEQAAAYGNPDEHPKGLWKSTPLHAKSGVETTFSYMFKNGATWSPPPGTYPRFSPETLRRLDEDDEIWFGKNGDATPSRKSFLSEVKDGVTPITLWPYSEVGHNHEASNELKALFPDNPFSNPKPTRLVRRMLELATTPDTEDLIIDFFAGSATTAHAILTQNERDGGNRKFIMAQLPEPTGNPDYPTIADIGKERIRRVIQKLNDEENSKLKPNGALPQDRGFKVFKLTSSNFKIWDGAGASEEPEDLAEQLRAFAENVDPNRSREDILYEILLKSGLPLTAEVERLEVAGRGVYAISGGLLMVCLEDHVDERLMRAVAELEPGRFVCLDSAFDGNDKLKTNTVLQMKSHNIEFRTV